MLDFIYVTGTILFFGLMLAYVSFCERIGRTDDAPDSAAETRP